MGENKSFLAQHCKGKRVEERMNPNPIKHSYQEHKALCKNCLEGFFHLSEVLFRPLLKAFNTQATESFEIAHIFLYKTQSKRDYQ